MIQSVQSIKTSSDSGDDRYRNKQSVSFMIHGMLPDFLFALHLLDLVQAWPRIQKPKRPEL